MANMSDLDATLNSLESQTYPIEEANEVILVGGGRFSQNVRAHIQANYSWVRIHQAPQDLEYLESKMIGAELVTGDVIVFVDSDVTYEPTWLCNILYGFVAVPEASIVAGETRIKVDSFYTLAVQLSWMMNAVLRTPYALPVTHFHLNNFAIYKNNFPSLESYKDIPLYRAHTTEWKKQLLYQGYRVVRVPDARGYHLPPGNFLDWWYRMLIYGADSMVKADFLFSPDGTVTEERSLLRSAIRVPLFVGFKAYVLFYRLYVLVREDPRVLFRGVIGVPLALFFIAVMVLGQIIGFFNPRYLLKKISHREQNHAV